MIKPKFPPDEDERLKNLESYAVLDSLPELEYDDITLLASQICETPIALIGFIDSGRQWYKSRVGISSTEAVRENAFCAHAILDPTNIMIVNDSRTDERFHDNPLVTGDPHVIFYAGVPLVSPDGYSLGALCVIDDKPKVLTSDQLRALEALRNQVIKLLELRKKTIRLETLVEKLELKNGELEKFASVAAHDIKSPLNNISSLIDMMMQYHAGSLNDEIKEFLGMIDQSSLKLRGLVDGILEHSRSEKLLAENKEQVDLNTFLGSISRLVNAHDKYQFIYPKQSIAIYINKTALEQVFINLIVNAIKYGDKEQVIIELGFSQSSRYYEFFVKDNGPGISEKYYEKIFKIFEVMHNEDRFGNRGNGIGLSTVKKLVEGLGGAVRVESLIGEGTTFFFTIEK